MSKSEIWDVHCHLSGMPGATPEQPMEALLKYADRLGVTRLGISMGMELAEHPSPEKMRRENDEVLQAIRQYSSS